MWSSRPVCARPVRTFPRSVLSVSTDLPIFCSAVFLMSAIMMAPKSAFGVHGWPPRRRWTQHARIHVEGPPPSTQVLAMDERALVRAQDHAPQRAGNEDREHLEQHVLVAAQRERSGVHHLE